MSKFAIGDTLIFEYTISNRYLDDEYVVSPCKIVYMDDTNYYFQPIKYIDDVDAQFSADIYDIDNNIRDNYTLSTSTLFKKL